MEDGVWLRTFYGPGSDAAFASLMDSRFELPGDNQTILDKAALYDYGSSWHRIFNRLPQLLDRCQLSAEEFQENMEEAKKEAVQAEIDDREIAEESGYDPDEDGEPWPVLYECYQWAATFGFLFIVDEKTLSPSSPHSGKVRVVWFDERGRVVRHRRETSYDPSQTMAGWRDCFVREHPVWANADVGNDYAWGASLGPPFNEEASKSGGNEGTADDLRGGLT